MNILIAGGAGFLGRNITNFLISKYPNYDITIADNFLTKSTHKLHELVERENVHVLEGDISDPSFVGELFNHYLPQVVINATGTKIPELSIKTHVNGTSTLLEQAKQQKTPPIFIQLSSDTVYGDDMESLPIETQAKTEDSPLNPNSVLSAAQASADMLVRAFNTEDHLRTVTLRLASIYGPYQREDTLLSRFLFHAFNNEDIPVYHEGAHTRSWLYVEDFIKLIDTLIHTRSSKHYGQVFNVTGAIEISTLKVVELILTMLNKPKELITFKDTPDKIMLQRNLDTTKVSEFFSWKPEIDFQHGLEPTIAWYQEILSI